MDTELPLRTHMYIVKQSSNVKRYATVENTAKNNRNAKHKRTKHKGLHDTVSSLEKKSTANDLKNKNFHDTLLRLTAAVGATCATRVRNIPATKRTREKSYPAATSVHNNMCPRQLHTVPGHLRGFGIQRTLNEKSGGCFGI